MDRYIGVSGIATSEDQLAVDTMSETILGCELDSHNIEIASGIQVSNKTVYGEVNKYGPLWYPVGTDIKKAGTLDGECVQPILHIYSAKISELFAVMAKAAAMTDEYRMGWQLNGLPFDEVDLSEMMTKLRQLYPYDIFILQCHRDAMTKLSPALLAEEVKRLRPDFALLDASGGVGIELSTVATAHYVKALSKLKHIHTTVAGGLNGDNLISQLSPLLKINPSLSWDAESGLRTTDPETGYKLIDLLKVRKYLEASKELLISQS